MKFRELPELLAEADARGMRRALVVTALPIEMRAVRAHLEHLGSCQGPDGVIYECGQFSAEGEEWFVVVAESGAGTHPAQALVTQAHRAFTGFELLLFVGVGGSRKRDAPIGSVIASSLIYMAYGGKYDAGRFTSRPRLENIERELLELARKVAREEEWPERIRPPLKRVLPKQADYPQPFPPAALVAPIISTEAVSADPNSELEQHIATNYGDAHAVEMEGYGAVFSARLERTPAIIIRGVSDMTVDKDPETDAVYQPVAAAHAAAFAFDLLNAWGLLIRRDAVEVRAEVDQRASSRASPANAFPAPPTPIRGQFVVEFEGSEADFPPARIEGIVETLKELTGDPSLRVIASEQGSFRLVIDVAVDAMRDLTRQEVAAKISAEHGAEVTGLAEEAAFREELAERQVLDVASRDLLDWRRDLPDGTWIERPELTQLLEIVEAAEPSTTVLLGPPGSGKSALLAALGSELGRRGWPLLAIKADLLPPKVDTEEALQAHLGLGKAPSVLLERIAADRPVVLLIDQLDALAGVLDLRTGRLTVLLNLVRRLGRRRNIRIVLSARTFEFEHDVRLRAVQADSLALELPAWSDVLSLLETRGVQAAGWPPDARELIRHPQALATFLQLHREDGAEPFTTYQHMLDKLWSERVLAGPHGPEWARLASDIAETMADEESLWLASARFDDRMVHVEALEAAGVLARNAAGGSLGFSHQTLFDHALARGFARGPGRLSSYVVERQSSLFIRPKLWAGLTYLRAVEPQTYLAELESIWRSVAPRRHLRLLLIDFLGQQREPLDREALLLTEVLERPDEQPVAFRAITGSPGWFTRTRPVVAEAMSRGDASADQVAGVLSSAWAFAPEVVEVLLRERWSGDAAHDVRTWMVLSNLQTWSEAATQLGELVLGRTDIAGFSVDHLVATIGVDQPRIALRLVLAKLDRDLRDALTEAERRASGPPPPESLEGRMLWDMQHSPRQPLRKLVEGDHGWESLQSLAEMAAGDFLELLWPWFLRLFEGLRGYEDPDVWTLTYAIPYGLDFRFEEEREHLPEPALLGALRVAAERLCSENEAAFLAWLSNNEGENAVPAQRLYAHALASRPEPYAGRALDFLLGDPRRFSLGGLSDFSSTTKWLVKSVAPQWNDAQLARFEEAVLGFAPPPRPDLTEAKERRSYRQAIRRKRLGLLEQLPRERVGGKTARLIGEEARAFPDRDTGVSISGVQEIGSPMESAAMARASDDDILRMFREVPDAAGWDHPRHWSRGGNVQLSRAFADFAKAHPERASRLIARFEPEFGSRAAGYALDAMAETADGVLVSGLFADLATREFDGVEFRGSAARAIERLVRRDVPIGDEVVTILERWLENTASDASAAEEDGDEEATARLNGDDKEDAGNIRSVLWEQFGMTMLPGGAYPVLEALTRVLLSRGEHDRLLVLLTAQLDRVQDVAVWKAWLDFLNYIRPTDDSARCVFLSALFERHPGLAQTREAAVLLAHAQWWAPGVVQDQLEAWENATSPRVRQAYGEVAALVAIAQPGLDWATAAVGGLVTTPDAADARLGAAFSAVNLWNEPGQRTRAAELLVRLIPQAESRSWTAIFDLFRLTDELTPEPDTLRVLRILANHIGSAGRLNATFVVERLNTLLPHEAPLVGRIARGLIEAWRSELGDTRTATALAAAPLVDLAVTLHRLGPETRELGTELFEELLMIDAYLARQTLDEIDSRFRPTAQPVRRRLPRRTRRTSRLLRAT